MPGIVAEGILGEVQNQTGVCLVYQNPPALDAVPMALCSTP